MKHIAIAAALLAIATTGTLAARPAAAVDLTIQPGQYRVTSAIVGQTKPTIRLECYTAEYIAGMFDATMSDGTCTDTCRVIASGKVDIARRCTGKRGASSGTVTGTYTPTSFTARIVDRGAGLPVPMDVCMVGQRVAAACTADGGDG